MSANDEVSDEGASADAAGSKYFTLEEVAVELARVGQAVALRTLRDHCTAGVLKAKKIRRTWFVDPAGIAAYREFLAQPVPVVRGPGTVRPAAGPAPETETPSQTSAGSRVLEETSADGRVRARAEGRTGSDGRFERHGLYVRFHADGEKAAEGRFENGRAHGEWREWHANGTLLVSGGFVEGQKEGRWTFFDSHGRKVQEGEFKGGLASGRWTVYHDDGAVWREGEYSDGRPAGEWKTHPRA